MPPKRKQQDSVPVERVTRLRSREAVACSEVNISHPLDDVASGGREQPAPAVKVVPVVEKLGRMMDRSMEENLLAFVDGFDPPAQSTTSFTDRTSKGRLSSSMRIARQNVREIECATLQQDKEDFVDDRSPELTFLEGVFSHSVSNTHRTVPTRRIHAAVFKCLKETESDEVAEKSFQLLTELEKNFPRMKLRERSSPCQPQVLELVINSKVWAPFDNLDTEDSYVDKAIRATEIEGSSVEEAFREILLSDDISSEQVNCHEFVKRIADSVDTSPGHVALADALLFRYLVDLLEKDFKFRMIHFEATHEIRVVQCSYMRKLLKGSDRAAAKDMFRNLQRMIWRSGNCVDGGSVANLSLRSSVGRNDICLLAERLIILCTKLGICEKDVQRSNLCDIVHEFPDDTASLQTFLQALSQSQHKMDFVTRQLLRNLTGKNFKLKQQPQEFLDVVRLLTDEDQAEKICRVFAPESLEVLLGHGFQAFCLLWRRNSGQVKGCDSLANFCRLFCDALKMQQSIESRTIQELHVVARCALALAESQS